MDTNQEIIIDYLNRYKDSWKDARGLRALLSDCIPERKDLRNTLVIVYEEGFLNEISSSEDINILSYKYVIILVNDYAIGKESASWAVETWVIINELININPNEKEKNYSSVDVCGTSIHEEGTHRDSDTDIIKDDFENILNREWYLKQIETALMKKGNALSNKDLEELAKKHELTTKYGLKMSEIRTDYKMIYKSIFMNQNNDKESSDVAFSYKNDYFDKIELLANRAISSSISPHVIMEFINRSGLNITYKEVEDDINVMKAHILFHRENDKKIKQQRKQQRKPFNYSEYISNLEKRIIANGNKSLPIKMLIDYVDSNKIIEKSGLSLGDVQRDMDRIVDKLSTL